MPGAQSRIDASTPFISATGLPGDQPADPPHRPERRENNFDVLRLALASLVLFSHSYPLTGWKDAEPLSRLTKHQITGGELAVDLFFVISGYLITQSWLSSRSTDSYLRKRIRRIYPGYLAAVLVSFALATVCAGPHAGAYVKSVLFYQKDVLLEGISFLRYGLLDSELAFPGNPWHSGVNGSLWTLQPELYAYLLVAGAGVLGFLRARQITTIFVVLACGYALQILRTGNDGNDLWRLLVYFGAGAVAYFHRDRLRLGDPMLVGVSVLALLIGASFPPGLRLMLPVAGPYLLLSLAFTARIRMHHVARKRDLSYGLYLYAFVVQQTLVYATGVRSPMLLFAMALPITCLCALGSWHVVERPALARPA